MARNIRPSKQKNITEFPSIFPPNQKKKVLIIEGLTEVYLDQKCTKRIIRDADIDGTRVWISGHEECNFCNEISIFGYEACVREIESGSYHALVVVEPTNPVLLAEFEDKIGPLLRRFVVLGGALAFLASRAAAVSEMIRSLFDGVAWTDGGSSIRSLSKLGPCEENWEGLLKSFGGRVSEIELKAMTWRGRCVGLRDVPPLERCFGERLSWTQLLQDTRDLVSEGRGREVRREVGGECITSVAVHNWGDGSIAFFGTYDSNRADVGRVVEFLFTRSPHHSVYFGLNLPKGKFDVVIQERQVGDIAFESERYESALSRYTKGIEKYGSKLGCSRSQKAELAYLYSKSAVCCVELKKWQRAVEYAEKAISLHHFQNKCLLIMSMALVGLAQERSNNTEILALLMTAKRELKRIPSLSEFGDAYKYYKKVSHNIERIKTLIQNEGA